MEENTTEEVVTTEKQDTLSRSKKLVYNHSFISTGIGLLPLPVIDVTLVSANQLVMLARLSNLYNVPFKKNVVKSLVSVLLYDLAAGGTIRIASSIVKFVPVVGSLLGSLTLSAYSLAATYAIGQVFIQHFEAGGTFLNFDPEAVKEYFKEQFEEGKKIAEEIKSKATKRRTTKSKTEESKTEESE